MTDTWYKTMHEMMRTFWKKHEKQPHVHVAAYSIQGRIFSQSRLLPDASGNTGSVLEEVNYIGRTLVL